MYGDLPSRNVAFAVRPRGSGVADGAAEAPGRGLVRRLVGNNLTLRVPELSDDGVFFRGTFIFKGSSRASIARGLTCPIRTLRPLVRRGSASCGVRGRRPARDPIKIVLSSLTRDLS